MNFLSVLEHIQYYDFVADSGVKPCSHWPTSSCIFSVLACNKICCQDYSYSLVQQRFYELCACLNDTLHLRFEVCTAVNI
jgi:hypothetical protein